jgi:hypothetical protein
MNRDGRTLVSFLQSVGGVLLLLALISCQAWAQAPSTNSVSPINTTKAVQKMPVVALSFELYDDHTADIILEFESSLESKFNFPQLLSTALSCQLRGVELTRDPDRNKTVLNAECDIPIRMSHFAQTGSLDLSRLVAILNVEPKPDFVLNISLPSPDFVRCDPTPMEFHPSANTANCSYFLESTDRLPEAIHFQYGYSFSYFARVTSLL